MTKKQQLKIKSKAYLSSDDDSSSSDGGGDDNDKPKSPKAATSAYVFIIVILLGNTVDSLYLGLMSQSLYGHSRLFSFLYLEFSLSRSFFLVPL